MTRSLGRLSWRPCAPWRKSLPARTLPITLPTLLSLPVARRLIVDSLKVRFYPTENFVIFRLTLLFLLLTRLAFLAFIFPRHFQATAKIDLL